MILQRLSPAPRALINFGDVILGLAAQALRLRALRALAAALPDGRPLAAKRLAPDICPTRCAKTIIISVVLTSVAALNKSEVDESRW